MTTLKILGLEFRLCWWFILLICVFEVSSVQAVTYESSLGLEFFYIGSGLYLRVQGDKLERKKDAPTAEEIEELDDKDLSPMDRPYAGRWGEEAAGHSNLWLAAGILSPLLIPEIYEKDAGILFLMYGETWVFTSGGVAYAKGLNSYYRPFAYGKLAPEDEYTKDDIKRSFFSASAARATSGFFFTAAVLTDYYPESGYNWLIWTTAIIASYQSGWSRVNAGMSFPSDAYSGMIWGALTGILVPLTHKKTVRNRRLSINPTINKNGRGISLAYRF